MKASGTGYRLSPRQTILALAIGWFVLRLVYLIWFSPWDLVGDEAYYWVQGQHPSLSYAEKGPLFAWLLYVSDALSGA